MQTSLHTSPSRCFGLLVKIPYVGPGYPFSFWVAAEQKGGLGWSRDVKIVFFLYSILGSKNSIFFRLSFIGRREKLVSTGVKYGRWVRQCVVNALTAWRFVGGPVCSLASRSSPAASAASVVHSSNSHCLTHTSFDTPHIHPGYRGSTTVATTTTYRRWSITARQSRHQKASRCRRWNLTLIDETGCFQRPYIKASSRAFTIQTRYTAIRAVSIKRVIVGRRGEGN